NSATLAGGGIYNNGGTGTANDSTITGNTAPAGFGADVFMNGGVLINTEALRSSLDRYAFCIPILWDRPGGITMTPEQIEALAPAFADYLDPFLFCCGYTQTFHLLGVYCRGLLSDLDRKTCEPMALAAGVAVRTLQEFLRDHRWSFDRARTQLQQHVAATLAGVPGDDLGTVGLHDETGTVKDRTATPGAQRQYCGEVGKVENCIATVHTGVAKGRYKTLCDAELFLPESWDQDRDRCRRAGIPEDVRYRPKWQIALGQLDR